MICESYLCNRVAPLLADIKHTMTRFQIIFYNEKVETTLNKVVPKSFKNCRNAELLSII